MECPTCVELVDQKGKKKKTRNTTLEFHNTRYFLEKNPLYESLPLFIHSKPLTICRGWNK